MDNKFVIKQEFEFSGLQNCIYCISNPLIWDLYLFLTKTLIFSETGFLPLNVRTGIGLLHTQVHARPTRHSKAELEKDLTIMSRRIV